MKKENAITWLQSLGYTFKGKNAYHVDKPGKRYVVGSKVLRYEVACDKTPGEPIQWVMIRHGYYGQMSITPENKLSGLKVWHL